VVSSVNTSLIRKIGQASVYLVDDTPIHVSFHPDAKKRGPFFLGGREKGWFGIEKGKGMCAQGRDWVQTGWRFTGSRRKGREDKCSLRQKFGDWKNFLTGAGKGDLRIRNSFDVGELLLFTTRSTSSSGFTSSWGRKREGWGIESQVSRSDNLGDGGAFEAFGTTKKKVTLNCLPKGLRAITCHRGNDTSIQEEKKRNIHELPLREEGKQAAGKKKRNASVTEMLEML